MKLYYSPGTCSLSPHIVLHEAGLAHELVLAPTKTHQLPDGSDYYRVNPLGYVPLLELDDGARLREGPVIVQYLADLAPAKNLIPAHGTMARYRVLEWLNFIGTELHKGFSPLFGADTPEATKTASRARLAKRFAWLEGELEGRDYLGGDHFCVADAYLYAVSGWAPRVDVDLSGYPLLLAWRERMSQRPAVQAALAMEKQAG